MEKSIVTIEHKSDDKFLRKIVPNFDFSFSKSGLNKKAVKNLIQEMKSVMKRVNGLGLSANQIGLEYRVFVAKPEKKWYVVFNPEIMRISEEKVFVEEGCLSVPLTYGSVSRPQRIIMRGQDQNGKPLKFKVDGLLARVFQHEIDHLNGVLFIDKAREVYKVEKSA